MAQDGSAQDGSAQDGSAQDGSTCDRRHALKLLGTALGTATLGTATLGTVTLGTVTLGGCTKAPEGPPQTRLPLAELEVGERLQIDHHGDPVEVRRTADGVAARSLLCTHTGCTVQWRADEERYHCPCHDAVFNARGEVLEGPPPRPLRSVPARVEDDEVVVG